MMISRQTLVFILLLLVGRAESQVPILLKDINVTADPSAATLGSDPRFLTNHNGTLFFTAKTNGTTTSLWKTNGKTSGTVKIADLPGTA